MGWRTRHILAMALRDMAEQSPKMKITIGIPCYNAERWIRQAIQSALEQRGVEPEVIIVDDGSTDSSLATVREFSGSVRLIEGGHRGANHARNLILKNATGEWVQYLDADDYLEPQKINTQLNEARGETDVIYSPVWIETTTAIKTTREQSHTSPDEDIFTQWIRWHIPQTGGALWRREPLSKLSWREEQPCCQEHELYLSALQAGLRFKYTPTPGAVYRIWSEETLCRKDPVLVTRVRTGLMERMLDWLKEEGKSSHSTAEKSRKPVLKWRAHGRVSTWPKPPSITTSAEPKDSSTSPGRPLPGNTASHIISSVLHERRS